MGIIAFGEKRGVSGGIKLLVGGGLSYEGK